MNAEVSQAVTAAGTQHQVQLDWQEASVGTSFEIYRSQTQGGQDYTTPLASVPVGTLTYTDVLLLVEGQTYYYTVLAVDVSGVKSDPSNEASALIPTKPSSPFNLVAKPL